MLDWTGFSQWIAFFLSDKLFLYEVKIQGKV